MNEYITSENYRLSKMEMLKIHTGRLSYQKLKQYLKKPLTVEITTSRIT